MAVDRRHAVSRPASAGEAEAGRGEVGLVGDRAQAALLPHHQEWIGAAGDPASAMARGGSHPARHLVQGELRMTLEEQISQWREFLRRRAAIRGTDVAELEDHLRSQVASLTEQGLAEDEAF